MYASFLQPNIIITEYMNLKFELQQPKTSVEVQKPQYKKEWVQSQRGLLSINIQFWTEATWISSYSQDLYNCYNWQTPINPHLILPFKGTVQNFLFLI
jgi:hypothetical protein